MTSDAELAGAVAEEAGRLLVDLRTGGLRTGGLRPGDPDGKALGALGDRRSHELIVARLGAARPDDAILSEEAADDAARLDAGRVWIVDPLDGTREFGLAGRSDWAVHVALWERGREITAAAVSLPAETLVFATGSVAAPSSALPDRPRIVVSDSRPPGFAPALGERMHGEVFSLGSAGAKAMAVVRGIADAYVHSGGQWEWDSAAPVGVALASGLHASRLDGSPLRYNQPHPYVPDLIICRAELARRLIEALGELVEPAG